MTNIEKKLDELKSMVTLLLGRSATKSWYTTQEFGQIVGRAPYTVREYCRLGLLEAQKRSRGRNVGQWVISARELERFQRDGLLPVPNSVYGQLPGSAISGHRGFTAVARQLENNREAVNTVTEHALLP